MKKIRYLLLLLVVFASCKKEIRDTAKSSNTSTSIVDTPNTNQPELMSKTAEELFASFGLDEEMKNSIDSLKQLENIFKDSVAVGKLLSGLMRNAQLKEQVRIREQEEYKKRTSGNFDDFMEAFNKLNAESGVVATFEKLKKADSILGNNTLANLNLDSDLTEMMSQKVNLKDDKITKKERQLIIGFNYTVRNVHNEKEIERIKQMMAQTDIDKMVDENKISKAYANQQKKEFIKANLTLKYKAKISKIAKRKFKKLNPDLYFGDNVGMTYFGNSEAIYLPLGKLSFADKVIHYYHPKNMTTTAYVIGEPDAYEVGSSDVANAHSLGTKGTLTIKFEDNALVDVNGPDLYIFEIGKIEPTDLEISIDGKKWVHVGKIKGGVAQVDIHDFVKPNELYYYVRLTDLETYSILPGADIDAIATIGAAMRLNLDSKVLFDSGKSILKPAGKAALKELVKSIQILEKGNIIVEGHTDDVGSEETNRKLSLARAKSVSAELKKLIPNKNFKWREKGLGESKPLVENDSDANRAKNRRVEILVLPN